MFWILNSENFASKPSFCTARAYLRDARRESSSLLAPGDDYLAGREDKGRRLGVADAHDDGGTAVTRRTQQFGVPEEKIKAR
jgi:hypothetical protein